MAFSPVKTVKKLGIGLEGFVDGVCSRFSSVYSLLLSSSLGTVAGALLGTAVMLFAGDNALDDHMKEKATYEALDLYVSFPDECDFDESYYFTLKGPNNKYGLYGGSDGHYKPLSKSEAADFVDDYTNCMQALRALPKLQQSMSLQRGYAISQPLRAIDTNNDDADDVVNWRELSRPSGSGSLTLLDTQAEVGADGDVVSAFEKTWSDAISDFEDGKIYDHAGDKNVTTFTYEDSYKSYNSNFILYGALGLGCLFGIGGGFGRNPSDSYKERCDLRDKRRTALDRNSVQF